MSDNVMNRQKLYFEITHLLSSFRLQICPKLFCVLQYHIILLLRVLDSRLSVIT